MRSLPVKEYNRLRYLRFRAAGVCPSHADRPAAVGKKMCQECIDNRKAKLIEANSKGKCSNHPARSVDPRSKTVCTACLERILARQRKLRQEILEAYGEKCECCGEDEPQFLSIDHTNNDGAEHRKTVKNVYLWLRKNGFPRDGFRLLCYNCNFGRRLGDCPHKSKIV